VTGLIGEGDGAVDDGCVFREWELDLRVAARCLKDAGRGRLLRLVDPRRKLRVAVDHGPAEALRRAEVRQLRRRDLLARPVHDDRSRRVALFGAVEERFLNRLSP
jgi:hypothetical protein